MSFIFIFYSEYKENIYNISKDDYAKLYKSCCLPTEIMKKKFVILNESYAKILHMVVKIEGHKIKSLSLSLSLSLIILLYTSSHKSIGLKIFDLDKSSSHINLDKIISFSFRRKYAHSFSSSFIKFVFSLSVHNRRLIHFLPIFFNSFFLNVIDIPSKIKPVLFLIVQNFTRIYIVYNVENISIQSKIKCKNFPMPQYTFQ